MTGTAVKLRLEGVRKQFAVRGSQEQFTALEDISLDLREGEFLVLVGPSGSGKSTLLDLLGGLSKPTEGRLLLDGKPITKPGLDRGIVFQQYALLPWRTARANIEFGLEAKGLRRPQRRELADHYLELVGLAGFGDRYPHELSGGMKQRVAIARSLAFDPEVLLMDEPFAALDAQTRESLQDELLRVWKATGKTILFITHGIDEAVYLGFGPLRLFQKVVLPAAVPSIFTGVRMAAASSILVLIAAEMVGARAGLGYLITAAQQNFQIPDMYAGILAISLLGLTFNGVLVALERRFSRWRNHS
ncbi:ATP-binding cassette domain-containing protein [Nocardia amikacinitolerans]|uniref:ATP-binding cassette domain-containing protein n=1 Tax=Nocardia amikacinitolerans TaxID=756689 RepID=UPI0036BC0471